MTGRQGPHQRMAAHGSQTGRSKRGRVDGRIARRKQPSVGGIEPGCRLIGARRPSQRGFGLVDQLPHNVGYGKDFFDSSSGLSRPNQRFSALSAPEPFDNFRPKACAVSARFIPFAAPFV